MDIMFKKKISNLNDFYEFNYNFVFEKKKSIPIFKISHSVSIITVIRDR